MAHKRMFGLLVAGAAIVAAPALAQSDGSIEDTYARQCPRHEDNDVCNALRKLMIDRVVGKKIAAAGKAQSPPATARTEPAPAPARVVAPSEAEVRMWGPVAGREDLLWRGPDQYWQINKFPLSTMKRGQLVPLPGGEQYLISTFWPDGRAYGRILMMNRYSADGPVRLHQGGGNNVKKLVVLPDGSIFLNLLHHALISAGPDAFDWVPGRLDGTTFVRDDSKATSRSGRYVRLSEAEARAFVKLTEVARIAKERELAQRKAQGGDSGLLGGLMMAAGAAMAGGNAQQVMGFGMKGAEMTTDNPYMRQALSGVGDQFVADGMQTMAMQNAARNPPAAGARPGAAPARAASSGPVGALPGLPGAGRGTTAYVACYLYGQYDDGTNRKWHFYISQIGQMQAQTGEAWPDSPRDAISQTWGAYLRQRGADVDGHAGGANPRYPTCHGSSTMADVQGQRAQWLRDARSGGSYTIHEENWAPR